MVMGIANFMTPALARLQKASESGGDKTLLSVWRDINPIVRVFGNGRYNAGVKAACKILGLTVGPVRAPIPLHTAAERESLKAALASVNPDYLTRAA